MTEDALKRVYDNGSNHDGRLTFEYIMKMGESCGVSISQKTAKAMIRRYGGRKDYLSFDDCIKINNKRSLASEKGNRK